MLKKIKLLCIVVIVHTLVSGGTAVATIRTQNIPVFGHNKIDVEIHIFKETGHFKSMLIAHDTNDETEDYEIVRFNILDLPNIVSKSHPLQSFLKNANTVITYTACISENPLNTFGVNDTQLLRLRHNYLNNTIECIYSDEYCQVCPNIQTGVVLIKVNILPPPQKYYQPGDCTVFAK